MKLVDAGEDELPAPITWTPPRGPPRRLRFSPCVAADADAWRVEEVWTGCGWRFVGRELVDDVRQD
jgi:hypothetical protein